MPVNWKEKAVSFDKLYSKNTWESKIPYLGNALRGSITDRMERAHAFAGSFKAKTCIDLGCGVGRFALQAAELGAITYGYDVSEDAIRIAKERAAAAGFVKGWHAGGVVIAMPGRAAAATRELHVLSLRTLGLART